MQSKSSFRKLSLFHQANAQRMRVGNRMKKAIRYAAKYAQLFVDDNRLCRQIGMPIGWYALCDVRGIRRDWRKGGRIETRSTTHRQILRWSQGWFKVGIVRVDIASYFFAVARFHFIYRILVISFAVDYRNHLQQPSFSSSPTSRRLSLSVRWWNEHCIIRWYTTKAFLMNPFFSIYRRQSRIYSAAVSAASSLLYSLVNH